MRQELGVQMRSKEPCIPEQFHMPERGMVACLEGSEGAPNLELTSFDVCSDIKDTSAFAAIMHKEDPEPAPHV